MSNWQQQVEQLLECGNYSQAASLSEQAIAQEPHVLSHYWYLGLVQLLQGQEIEAQSTWLLGMSEGESQLSSDQISPDQNDSQIEQWTTELVNILHTEANRQQALGNDTGNHLAWLLRRHMHEIEPADINNLLQIMRLAMQLQILTIEELRTLDIITTLQTITPQDWDHPELNQSESEIDSDLLLQVLKQAFNYPALYPCLIELIVACLPHIADLQAFVNTLIAQSVHFGYYVKQPELAIQVLQLCLQIVPDDLEVLKQLSALYQNIGQYEQCITISKRCYSLSQHLPDRIYANHILLRGLLGAGGYWTEAIAAFQKQEALLAEICQSHPISLSLIETQRLFITSFYAPYLQDCAQHNRLLHNQVGQVVSANVQIHGQEIAQKYQKGNGNRIKIREKERKKKMRIGYLSHCFKQHSVGWLARWLLQHHDRDRFEIYGYFMAYQQGDDPLQTWYVSQMDRAFKVGVDSTPHNYVEVAERIYQNELDILVDLDSMTLDVNCGILSLKPAPVQATWLGWDASGLPEIDYFIADPYVLPKTAQDYYSETIWRLPQTYIAVDGFEVAVPNLRRRDLHIPNDAIIYLSAQRGYKRNPETVRLQMQILKAVPHSYFLIKGIADQNVIQDFFLQIAAEEGINSDRLRFLDGDPSEAIHRANLAIADVVLDTYPYNGATTTLETLWMGIPLVTRVGEQFSARNSYTMLMNVGVTEGIAWTDAEYVEWGIRLGAESQLRQKVAWKLRQSRQTSPLWNAIQFTREMENAYTQMWVNYAKNFSDL